MTRRLSLDAYVLLGIARRHPLIQGLSIDHLVTEWSHESNAEVVLVKEHDKKAVIPPSRNRKEVREYDRVLYRKKPLSAPQALTGYCNTL